MKSLKKTIFGFCVFLLVSFLLLIPFSAKTSELDSRFGINAFILNRYEWEGWNVPLELLDELKVSWTREEFVWSMIETEKGEWNWDFYDRAFENLANSDINILGIIDYSAPWATSNPDIEGADKYMPDIACWREFVDRVVERYGDRVKYWQIWNEENIPVFFKPEPNVNKYYELLKNASEVIRARDSSARVVLGGTSGVDMGYLRSLKDLGASQYFDILAVHPYRLDFESSPEENGLMRDLGLAQDISEEFDKPIWLTEFGWPTDKTEGVDENLQANYLARTYLMSFTFPAIEKLFWYDLRNDGNDLNYREHNFGLVNRDYSKKKSFYVYKNLIDLLEHSHFEKINKFDENGLYEFVFTKGNEEIRAMWKLGNEENIALEMLNADEIYSVVGEKIFSMSTNQKPLFVSVSDSPIFIIKKNEKKDIFDKNNYNYEYIDQSSHVSVGSGEEAEVWLKLKNTGSVSWKNYGEPSVLLGTCRDQDRISGFFDEDSWIGNNRPAKISEEEVGPGESGTFKFRINPKNSEKGEHREYFCPVVEGITWLRDIGIYWDIEITDNKKQDEESSFDINFSIADYDYEYIDQSSYLNLSGGEVAALVLRLKNTGKENWEKGKLNLGTSSDRDRTSIFNKNWLSKNRISLDQDIVKTGEIGTFTFEIRAPNKDSVYKEYFQPVLEGVGWLKDIGIYWEITVS